MSDNLLLKSMKKHIVLQDAEQFTCKTCGHAPKKPFPTYKSAPSAQSKRVVRPLMIPVQTPPKPTPFTTTAASTTTPTAAASSTTPTAAKVEYKAAPEPEWQLVKSRKNKNSPAPIRQKIQVVQQEEEEKPIFEKKKKQKKPKKIVIEEEEEAQVDDGLTVMERRRVKKAERNKIKRAAYKKNKQEKLMNPKMEENSEKIPEEKSEVKEEKIEQPLKEGKIEEEFTTVLPTKVVIFCSTHFFNTFPGKVRNSGSKIRRTQKSIPSNRSHQQTYTLFPSFPPHTP